MPATGITFGIDNWQMQNNYVERMMDNAAYSAAHPDDTLVLAGPPRIPTASAKGGVRFGEKLLAIGHLQSCQFTQQKPTQPVMAIGSGRSFFVSGKAQGQATLGRLFVNGRNLMRVLHHNARLNNVPVTEFDDKPSINDNSQYYINLDSELYLIPIGLAVLFQDKIHENLGGFYAELTMITSYAVGFNAGQNMIMEQTTLVFDRLYPYYESSAIIWAKGATLHAVMGFTDNTVTNLQTTKDIGIQPT